MNSIKKDTVINEINGETIKIETYEEDHIDSGYHIIENYIMYSKKLTMGSKLLYGIIRSLANSNGYCWASNRYLSEKLNVSKDSITKWIKELKDNNYLKVFLRRSETKEIIARYLIIDEKLFYENNKNTINPYLKNIVEVLEKTGVPLSEKTGVGIRQDYADNNIIYNNTNNNNIRVNNDEKEKKEIYGEFRNVLLTNTQYTNLSTRYGSDTVQNYIERLSRYDKIGKYKDHYKTLINWMEKDKDQKKREACPSPAPAPKQQRLSQDILKLIEPEL